MSIAYRAVQWNPFKKRHDLLLIAGIIGYLSLFILISKAVRGGAHALSDEILMIRALGTCAILLLHIVLAIGPLARIDRRFSPLLYNRRHLGVAAFTLALLHALLAAGYYHGFGVLSPTRSLLISSADYRSLSGFPFEIPGLLALTILFFMAATSHDFWLRNLTPRVWKTLHMAVYFAYFALVAHVALGALQSEPNPVYVALIGFGVLLVAALHLIAGRMETTADRKSCESRDGWIDAGPADAIEHDRAKTVRLPDRRRVAIFREGDHFSAIGDVCAHQGGPLGEGRIVNGCVTCPWHGYQYLARNGQSPPPFTERIPTFRLKLVDGRLWLDPLALPPGTPVQPVRLDRHSSECCHE